jgi:hypothetical protein
MPIYTDGLPTRRNTTLDEYSAGLGETLYQTAREALIRSPTLSVVRAGELSQAMEAGRGPEEISPEEAMAGVQPVAAPERVDAVTARQKIKESGVKLDVSDDGINSRALDILIERKQDEMRRNDIIQRGPTGFVAGTAKFGTAFAASILDPINVGTAFVPIVGQARYAQLLARAGTTGSRVLPRLAVGAAEGLAGAALVEPIIYGSAKFEQADYGMLDSALNIGFGAVFGGGLHVLGGSGADFYRAYRNKPDPFNRLLGLSTDQIKQVYEVDALVAQGINSPDQVIEIAQKYPPSVLRAAGLIRDTGSIDRQGQDVVLPRGTIYGEDTQVSIGQTKVAAQWAVVDLVDVEAAMTKADNQWRDRTRQASSAQIREISNNPDYDQLQWSPVMDYGAPTLSKDGLVIGGNGRVMGISTSYDIGKVGNYRSRLLAQLDEFGVDPTAIDGMKKPMLVRVLREDVDIKQAAIISNEGGAARMSALEQAGVDAERLKDFRGFDIPESGDLNTAGNRGAIKQWVGQFPVNQQSALLTSEGYLSKEGLTRLRNAILYRAYGDSPILKRLVESTDDASANLSTALIRSAGVIADARARIAEGRLFDADISDDLQAAVSKLTDLRSKGMDFDDYMSQGDILGRDMTPEQLEILRFLDDNIRSARAISGFINEYYAALDRAGDPTQGDIFGGVAAPTKMDLIDQAMDGMMNDPSASAKINRVSAETREAALRVSVAQLAEGQKVNVDPIIGADQSIGTTTRDSAVAAANEQQSIDALISADADAAAGVAARSKGVVDAQQSLDDALFQADEVVKQGNDAYKYSRATKPTDAESVPEAGKNAITGDLDKVNPAVREAVLARIDRLPKEEQARVMDNLEKFKGTAWAAAAVKGMAYREMLDRAMAGQDISMLEKNEIWGKQDMAATKIIKAFKKYPQFGDKILRMMLDSYEFIGGNRKAENDISTSFTNCDPSRACAVHCYAAGSNARPNEIAKSEFTEFMIEKFPDQMADKIANDYLSTAAGRAGLSLRLNDKGDLSPSQVVLVNKLNERGIAIQIFSKRPELLRQMSEMNLKMLSVDSTNIKVAMDNPDLRLAVTITDDITEAMLSPLHDRVSVYLPVNLKGKAVDPAELAQRFPDLYPKMKKNNLCPVDGGKKITQPGVSFVQILDKTAEKNVWTCTACDLTGTMGCFYKDRKTSERKAQVVLVSDLQKDLQIQKARKELQSNLDQLLSLGGIDGELHKELSAALSSGKRAAREIADYDTETGIAGEPGGAPKKVETGGDGTGQDAQYARGAKGEVTETVDSITTAAVGAFGRSTEKLLEVGQIKIVNKADELPDGPHPEDVRGMTGPDGTVYIVAENVKAAEVPGLILHEVGEHVGMEQLLGPIIYKDVLAQVAEGIARGDAKFVEAASNVPKDTPSQHVASEQLAYLIENAPELSLVKQIIAAVRAWAYRTFQLVRDNIELTEADIRALAVSSLHAVAKRERMGLDMEFQFQYSRGADQANDMAAEMRLFDDAISKAEVYGKAIRAAAERISDDAAAQSAMQSASQGTLTKQEIDDLLAQLRSQNASVRNRLRKIRESSMAQDVASSLQSDAMQAADELANNLMMAAVIEKRNAALNLAARMKALSFVQGEFKGMEVEGFKALIAGSEMKRRGARASAQAEINQFLGQWMGGIIAEMERAGLWRLFTSEAMARDTARALYMMADPDADMSRIPREAVQMAEIINKYQNDARNTQNRFGAWIRDLKGYIVRQTHDPFRVRKASFNEWRDFVLPRIDIDKTFISRGVTDIEAGLREMYSNFASGQHMKFDPDEDTMAAFRGQGLSLARKASQSRTLYFKDGDAWYDYNDKFGSARFADAVLGGLERSARSAGLMKIFGTNPEAAIGRMLDEMENNLRGDPEARIKLHESRKAIMDLMAHVDGTANIPANQMAARISAGVRTWQSMSKLGGAVISSITDIPVYAAEQRFQGRTMFSGIADAINGLLQGRGSQEQQEIMNSLGVFFDSMRNGVLRRFDGEQNMGGTMTKLQNQFFKWNGLTWWTETLRKSAALSLSANLAFHKDTRFVDLRPDLQNLFRLYNIDEGKWDLIRMASTKEADGRIYMIPEGIASLPREALENYIVGVGRQVNDASVANLIQDIQGSMRSMFIDRAEHAVIEPDARTKAFLLRGTNPGTVWGEIARFFAQFKSFPVAILQKTIGREIYGRGYDNLGDYLKNGKGDMLGMANMILWMSLFGYGAMAIKDLIKGRSPRDPLSPSTWAAAMLQGGAFGIYGDFLFGEMKNRHGGGFLATVAGPTFGTMDDLADLWGRLKSGDDAAAQTFRLVIANTPFMNLFYTRMALDYLILYRVQEWLNPGYLRRMERRIERENDQTFLIKPSEVIR